MRRYLLALSLFTATSLAAQQVQSPINTTALAQGGASAGRVTVDIQGASLESAVQQIVRAAGVNVSYDRTLLTSSTQRVTIKFDGVSVGDALTRVLRGTGLILTRSSGGELVITRVDSKKEQGIIAGKVTDAKTGRGVSGANVSFGNDMRAAVTDENGSYRLTGIVAGAHTIAVRMVGYAKQTKSVVVGDDATVTVNFKLEPSASVLNDVVVTGTVISTELKAVPNAITVITAKQIEERGITRIDQLFRGDVPGLFATNMGSGSYVDQVIMFSRGATALTNTSAGVDPTTGISNPIKTYVDGVEMANSLYLSQIDPASIERIEVLTGPQASTIYGANAINGVMQIFTKRGINSLPQITMGFTSGVIQNDFSANFAPNHLLDIRATGTEGRWSYNIGGSWNYLGSWTPGNQTQRASVNGGGKMELGRLTIDISARQGLTQSRKSGEQAQVETNLRAMGQFSPTSSAGLPRPMIIVLNGRTTGLSLGWRSTPWWSHELVLGSDASAVDETKTKPGFGSVSDTTISINPTATSRTSQRYSTTAQLPISSFLNINMTLGGDRWRNTGSTSRATMSSLSNFVVPATSFTDNKPDKNSGVYAQGQFGLWDALFLTYGVRADWNPNFGNKAKVKPGRYGVSYAKEFGYISIKLRGSYGRSIRPPASGRKFARAATSGALLTQFGQFDTQIANPDLGPEHQQGGEGGVELYVGNRGSLIITRYNQTVDNLISSVNYIDSVPSLSPVAPNTNNCDFNSLPGAQFTFDSEGHCFVYQSQNLNVGSIRNQGWELNGNLNVGYLTVRGTYSWTKSRVIGITPKFKSFPFSSISAFEPGRPFNYLPEHTWALGGTYSRRSSTVSLFVNGIGMRYVLSDALSLSASNRLTSTKYRVSGGAVRAMDAGYATADLNANHRFSSRMDAVLQIANLTNYYKNDFSASYTSIGRQTKLGVRVRMN